MVCYGHLFIIIIIIIIFFWINFMISEEMTSFSLDDEE